MLRVRRAKAAVEGHKRREVAALVREYLRRFPLSCQWRFDAVSVYYGQSTANQPQIEVFRNSSLSAQCERFVDSGRRSFVSA
jgi:hypothetical protein